jgi:hypothetical protein
MLEPTYPHLIDLHKNVLMRLNQNEGFKWPRVEGTSLRHQSEAHQKIREGRCGRKAHQRQEDQIRTVTDDEAADRATDDEIAYENPINNTDCHSAIQMPLSVSRRTRSRTLVPVEAKSPTSNETRNAALSIGSIPTSPIFDDVLEPNAPMSTPLRKITLGLEHPSDFAEPNDPTGASH